MLLVYTMFQIIGLVIKARPLLIRDWSLITGRGGATKREGVAHTVLPLRKGGGGYKVLAMLKGDHKKFGGRLYAVA